MCIPLGLVPVSLRVIPCVIPFGCFHVYLTRILLLHPCSVTGISHILLKNGGSKKNTKHQSIERTITNLG